MTKFLTLIATAIMLAACANNSMSERQPPPDPRPQRFLGSWESSQSEFVTDNLAVFMANVQKRSKNDISQIYTLDREKIVRELATEFPDANSSLRFMDNGLVEFSQYPAGAVVSAFLYRWTYHKGEVHLKDDFGNTFTVCEFAGQLIREVTVEGVEGVFKIRYNKKP